jgi:signal transduction histidine kinase
MKSAHETINIYKTDTTKAMTQATDVLLPKVSVLFETVTQTESEITQELQKSQQHIRRLVDQGIRWGLYLAIFSALAGLLFAVSTFRSLTKSLRILQEGTEIIGKGNWDHRIALKTKNELGVLAKSFNEMAESIKKLEDQVVHMHRMSAVGQLAGGVAHEINNPLTGVLGQAQLLLEKLPADSSARSNVEKIERAAIRCKRIVRSLLDFSRQKETNFATVNVNEVIAETLELCEPDLQSKLVKVEKKLDENLPTAQGNAPQLQQVFLNLMANAQQAMDKGGTITITSKKTMFKPLDGSAPVEAVEVVVTDSGCGIHSEYLKHIFEPFFTTKEIGKGTGLGLSVSLGIMRNHEGDIVAESEGEGKGATFHVFLPLVRRSAPETEAALPNPLKPAMPQEMPYAGGQDTRF